MSKSTKSVAQAPRGLPVKLTVKAGRCLGLRLGPQPEPKSE